MTPHHRPTRATPLRLAGLVAPGLSAPRVALWGLVLALVAAFVWTSPMSPWALGRADAALGQGRPERAVQQYDAIARTNPMPSLRAEALRRSAMVWSVELSSPREARKRLERLAHLTGSASDRARVHEQVGLLLLEERQPSEAARVFHEAHDAWPGTADAGRRLLRAARAEVAAHDHDAADRTWATIAERHPELRTQALVGRAQLHLRRGDAETALPLFEQAVDEAVSTDVAAVARLGLATCLERLGDLDEALAEIDAADLPPEVAGPRAYGIRSRRP